MNHRESRSSASPVEPGAVCRIVRVHMDKIVGERVKAWWFNPRDGLARLIGDFPNTGEREFAPPDPGEHLDWVLVLDDASKGYPPPGSSGATRRLR